VTLYLLGTGAAVSDPHRTTTMLAVEEAGRVLLVDCGGDAVQRLLAVGLDPAAIHAVVLTHEHPDHIGGFPLLVEKLWLLGRRDPLPVYGPAATLAVARALFACFSTAGWDGVPEREWHEVPMEPDAVVFHDDTFHVTATPVDHPVPTIGLRVEGASGGVLAYSCDTAKDERVRELARDADLLVHEATGSQPGVHASAEEAAETAAEAGAGRLVLVHLPPALSDEVLTRARHVFTHTEPGEELGVYPLARMAGEDVPGGRHEGTRTI
jgi:ribonuclease Z